MGDRIILFNIIDNDDNTLDHHNVDDDIPPQVETEGNNDISGSTNGIDGNKNVLNDSPDNSLDENNDDDSTSIEKTKLDNASTTHSVSIYLLLFTILAFITSRR